jgi:hypothetical protein
MSKFSHRFGLNDSDDHMAAHYGPFNHSTVVLYGGDGAGKANPGAPGTPGSGVVSAPVTGTSSGLIINVSYDASVSSAPADFKETIAQVVNYFQATFSDPITINISVGYGEAGGSPMSGGAIGQSLTYLSSFSYSKLKNALAADSKTTADASAVASLPGTDPAGTGHYWVSTAEGKALGLISSSTGTDGFVGFSSAAGIFDYNNGDGVGAGQYDFYGVVAHEFSEVMGRILLVGGTVGSSSTATTPSIYSISRSRVSAISRARRRAIFPSMAAQPRSTASTRIPAATPAIGPVQRLTLTTPTAVRASWSPSRASISQRWMRSAGTPYCHPQCRHRRRRQLSISR